MRENTIKILDQQVRAVNQRRADEAAARRQEIQGELAIPWRLGAAETIDLLVQHEPVVCSLTTGGAEMLTLSECHTRSAVLSFRAAHTLGWYGA